MVHEGARSENEANSFLEIVRSRDGAWETVTARRHEVLKIYLNEAAGLDLFIIGGLVMTSNDGSQSSHEFVARAQIHDHESNNPRISQYRMLLVVPKTAGNSIVN